MVETYLLHIRAGEVTELVTKADYDNLVEQLTTSLVELNAARKALMILTKPKRKPRPTQKTPKPSLIGPTKTGAVVLGHPLAYTMSSVCRVRCACGFEYKTTILTITRPDGAVRCRACIRKNMSEIVKAKMAAGTHNV